MRYAKAPYNFIPLSNRVFERYSSVDDLPGHDEILEDHYSGTIEYVLKCDSDIIVSDGKGNFFKNLDNKYAIPGSSIRGMVRNNIITLGFSSVKDDIEDNNFLYRRFATELPKINGMNTKCINKEYKDRLGVEPRKVENGNKKGSKSYSIPTKVKAGYIQHTRGDKYEIIPSSDKVNGKTYFRVSDNFLKKNVRGISEINYLSDKNYKPYRTSITYNVNEKNNKIKEIKKNGLKYKGELVGSGYMNRKTSHYIVTNISENEPIKISDEDIRMYKKYYRQDKKEDDFYSLPRNGEKKAVFYVEYNGRIFIGFTPFIRLLYDKSVHDGLLEGHKNNDILDYNKSLFGFTNNNDGYSYKSRLSFEDAVEYSNIETKKEVLNLQKPKATCIAHYLKQNGKNYSTYNNDFQIRGIKFYWMKDKVSDSEIGNEKICSSTEVVKRGGVFKGKISFKNLSEDELGLLVYSLALKDNCFQQIGMGKPYGFGRIKIDNIKIEAYDMEKRYNSIFDNGKIMVEKDKVILKYKKYMSEKFGITDIDQDLGIKTLLKVKSSIVKEEYYRYQSLKMFAEYYPLETAERIIEKYL